jgi:hypothetical protein
MSTSEKDFQDLNPLDFTLDKILSYLASDEENMVLAVLPSKDQVDELTGLIWASREYMKLVDKIYCTSGIIQGKNTNIYLTTPDDMGGIYKLPFTKVIDWRK